MDNGLDAVDCFICAKHALGDNAVGGVLFEDDLVYAGHAFTLKGRAVYRGYLVAEPKRHVSGLGDLSDEEAGALGQLVTRLARVLTDVAGADHVYMATGSRTFTSFWHLDTRVRHASTGAFVSGSGRMHPGSTKMK